MPRCAKKDRSLYWIPYRSFEGAYLYFGRPWVSDKLYFNHGGNLRFEAIGEYSYLVDDLKDESYYSLQALPKLWQGQGYLSERTLELTAQHLGMLTGQELSMRLWHLRDRALQLAVPRSVSPVSIGFLNSSGFAQFVLTGSSTSFGPTRLTQLSQFSMS